MFLFRCLIFLPSTCLTWNFVKGQKIKQERGKGNMGGGEYGGGGGLKRV
jgi:hypothetical protein